MIRSHAARTVLIEIFEGLMITVLFWNLHKNPNVLDHLPCLAKHHRVDVFLLAEIPDDVQTVIDKLNIKISHIYRDVSNETTKVVAITRLGEEAISHRFSGYRERLDVWSITAPQLKSKEILLAGVHLPSKSGGNTETAQFSAAKNMMMDLASIEDKYGHQNTILVGDFNMNPYDPGMTSVDAVHGLMTRSLAEKPDREYLGKTWRRFYNPMWGLFGDRTPGPAGGYFWRSSVPTNTHWSMLDQVLVRPGLIDSFHDLTILNHDGEHSLVGADGTPDRNLFSDHLPLLFQIDV